MGKEPVLKRTGGKYLVGKRPMGEKQGLKRLRWKMPVGKVPKGEITVGKERVVGRGGGI